MPGTVRALAASDLFDTGTTSTPSASYILASPFSRWVWTTDAAEVWIKGYTNLYSNFATWAYLAVLSNGSLVGTIAASADGVFAGKLALPAGAKTVEIVSSLQSKPSSTVIGTFPTCVYFFGGSSNGTAMQSPSASGRLLIYGDSIAVGANATAPTTEGWATLLRAYRGNVALEAWGYRSLNDDASDGTARAAFVTQMASYSPSIIWLAIGTNDYGLNKWTAANFGTAYAALLDDLHTALPSATIYCQTPLVRSTETANGSGSTLGNYRTQISTAQSTRSAYAVLVDGSAILTTGDLDDGVHPTTEGHALYYAAVKTTLGI